MAEETGTTKVSKVYDTFLSKIKDHNLITEDTSTEELEEELFGFFESAAAKFYKCKKDLSLDEKNQLIQSKLSQFEIEIIVKLMLVEYMTPVVLSSEVMLQSLSDKDFKIHSQASQMQQLSLLYRQLQKEATKMITEYSYLGMTDE